MAGGSLSANLAAPWGDYPSNAFWQIPIGTAPILARYDGVFASNYIAELFTQLAYVGDHVDVTAIRLPSQDPDLQFQMF